MAKNSFIFKDGILVDIQTKCHSLVVKCNPGAYEFAYNLYERDINIAIVSDSPVFWVKKCFEKAHSRTKDLHKPLLTFLGNDDNIFSSKDCKDSKPYCSVFKKARHYLNKNVNDTEKIKELLRIIFVVVNTRTDVVSALSSNYYVLYVSETDTSFDKDYRVRRFQNLFALFDYIVKNLI